MTSAEIEAQRAIREITPEMMAEQSRQTQEAFDRLVATAIKVKRERDAMIVALRKIANARPSPHTAFDAVEQFRYIARTALAGIGQ